MRFLPACILVFAFVFGGAPSAPASTLVPSHPVWTDPSIDHEALANALAQLRLRTEKEPRGFQRQVEAFARKSSLGRVRRFLVIPVVYSDGPEEGPVAIEELQSSFFDPSRVHSFAWYWETASGGALLPRGEVLPWIRLPGPRSLYQNVVDGRPRLTGTRRMAEDAICAAAPSLGPWWDYDDDGPDGIPGSGDDDGFIDFLIVLHPDEGIEIKVESDGIMALQDRLNSASVLEQCGVGADPFVVASALDPVGVWVHESGHLMGLVDLYDLKVSADESSEGLASGGLGLWSLMATGTWGGNGSRPTGLDAYSRSLLGWGVETEVQDEDEITLAPSASGGNWIRLSPAMDWGKERFLLEVRSAVGGSPIDEALPGEGVLIYRVDEDGRRCSGADSLVVALMQADGKWDLEKHANQGDAGDPYTGQPGADELGPSTVPSSFSRHPSISTLPPRIRIDSNGDGSYRVRLQATARSRLLLREADFDDGEIFFTPGEQLRWLPVFKAVGEAVTSARMRLTALTSGVEVDPPASVWVDLRAQDGGYRPQSPITFSSGVGLDALDLPVEIELEIDGAPSSLRLGIPVGIRGGIAAGDFQQWTPGVIDPGTPETAFTWVVSSQCWRVSADSPWAYGNCCDLQLQSPWIAPLSSQGEEQVVLWSRAHTEEGNPQSAFDGGVLEWRQPGRAWLPLTPREGPWVRIFSLSRSSTAGEVGLGGRPRPWQELTAVLPRVHLPYQLRLRFGSDADGLVRDEEGGWEVKGLRVGEPPPSSILELARIEEDRWSAILTVTSAPESLSASLWGRTAPAVDWTLLAPEQELEDGGTTRFVFLMPPSPYLEVGAFEGGEARVLLARAGHRPSTPALKVFPNPSATVVQMETGATGSDRSISIFDLRGRRVKTLVLPAHLGLVRWDGKDEKGRRVASGSYLALLDGEAEGPVVFTLLR